jgi:hypothetical protein
MNADQSVVWLSHLNAATAVVAPIPAKFTEANSSGKLTPIFSRRAVYGEH